MIFALRIGRRSVQQGHAHDVQKPGDCPVDVPAFRGHHFGFGLRAHRSNPAAALPPSRSSLPAMQSPLTFWELARHTMFLTYGIQPGVSTEITG